MNTHSLNKLEFNKILEILSTYCNTYLGKEISNKLLPSNNKLEVKQSLSETETACNIIERIGLPPISSIKNIEIFIKLLESYSSISAKALIDISNILNMSEDLKKYFSEIEENNVLQKYFSKLYSNNEITKKIQNSIIDAETIADNASPKLKSIRQQYKKAEQDIKNQLNKLIHSSTYSKYLQENIVTIRNDRFVIPVKQEYRSQIKGFIHDISSSGSTVFIEPLSVFETNNLINNLKVEETAEIERILHELSSLLFPYTKEIQTDLNIIGILDFIFAKAKYSKSIKGTTPKINSEKQIDFLKARHPLINPTDVVPISINIGKDFSLLIITGPNTGGKTVTLKTVGLLLCMAYSGLNIPVAENSTIYVFDEIFTDIGDDQSISDSLSTFSSHIKNITDIVNTATSKSLVLVDELGSGTDPLEGANLAISILEYLKNKNILCIATTHYQELKKYALITENVQNASVEFDIENLKPTYKLLIGVPGKSNAFAISEKLGLKKEILDKANLLLSHNDIDFETLLKNIYDEKLTIEKEKEEIDKTLNQVTLLKNNLQRDDYKLREQERELISNAKVEARNILLNAKDEATSFINKMKEISSNNENIKDLNNIRNSLNNSIKAISVTGNDSLKLTPLDSSEIIPNKKVFVSTLGQNGIVISKINKSNEVQVQVGLIKTYVNIKYLEKPQKLKNDLTKLQSSTATSKISKTQTVNSEINVIGLAVDEALPLVDKFLDDCFLAKLKTARIVHGKGTGKLRQGIHSYLKQHNRVKSFRIRNLWRRRNGRNNS